MSLAMAAQADLADGEYPHVVVSNAVMEALVYLPDAETGYYRGTRFEWSGIVGQVKHCGHTYFGPLRQKRDPGGHDHATGPVEEFGMDDPLGFEEAAEGETFVKIGVGRLVKTGDSYAFGRTYKFAEPGAWDVSLDTRSVRFAQKLADPRGWGYEYVKVVELDETEPVMRVLHTLTNTGKRPIRTQQYNHAMVRIDGDAIGANTVVEFGFDPQAVTTKPGAEITGRTLRFLTDPLKGSFHTELKGSDKAEENDAVVRNLRTGASFRISMDRPAVKYCVYAEPGAVCPEPFVAIEVEPGQSFAWVTRMEFGAGRE